MLYEMYFDIVLGGQYIWEIKRLHDVYGSYTMENE